MAILLSLHVLRKVTYDVFLLLLQVPMSIAWAVRIVKKSCINSTFSLASVRHARGKTEKIYNPNGLLLPFFNFFFLKYWDGWFATFCFEQTILKLIIVELKVLNS